jgi:predicted nucleic acid-binding Zn finger protein
MFEPSGRVVWIVVGKEKDYQIIPVANYCSCDDFYYRVVNGDTSLCYHVIAQKLSEALNKYELITDSDTLYDVFMKEWRFIKKEHIGG